MICSRLQTSFLLFLTILLIICVSHGVSQSSITRRNAVGTNESYMENSTLFLAAKRTYRRDPTDGFKRSGRGWNISDNHYWASVGCTAVPLFIIEAIGFVIFGMSMSHLYLLLLLSERTIMAIIGCVVLYTGQGKFHGSTIDTFEYVLKQVNFTVDSLRNVSSYLASAQNITFPYLLKCRLRLISDNIQTRINSSANALATRTDANKDKIQITLDTVRLILIIVAPVMLFLAFLCLYAVFSIFGKFIVSILVVIGWIVVAGTFLLYGVLLLFHNVVGDTCVAIDEWVQHPTAHTALDDILPCLQSYLCKISATGICATVGRITPDFYTQMNAAVNVSYGLYTYSPFQVNLEDCSFVRETFSTISKDYCGKWIYIGLVLVSSAVMLSLIFWVIYAREHRDAFLQCFPQEKLYF
ncbi:hypothetical protein MKX03_020727 [Papaver bracteatum]|nr:hypothetical protein MKX03_020727 [Papaver bracteatum]